MLYEMDASIAQGQRLKTARKLTLLSRRAFAVKHSFNISSYQAMEDGRYKKGISISNAHRLIKTLLSENITCSIEWLLHGNGEHAKRKISYDLQSKISDDKEIIRQTKKFKRIKKLNFDLINAIQSNDLESCKKIIILGANLHELTNNELYIYSLKQNSALHFAASYCGNLVIKLFIEMGLNPNIRNRVNDMPIHMASYEGNNKAIVALLENNAVIDPANNDGTTPLMWAAYARNPTTIELLLQKGAVLDNLDFIGNTPLHWAAFIGFEEAIKISYDHGAKFDVENHQGKTPLDMAVKNGHQNTVQTIIELIR